MKNVHVIVRNVALLFPRKRESTVIATPTYRRGKQSLILILCITILISGCATTGDYRLKVGDELRVVIWKKLDEKAIIRPDQKISLPLAGEISCKNKTPDELSKELSKKYEAETTVMVSKYHTFKDDLKEIIGFIRDAAIVYFIGERIANEGR
jgi:protein involved in polysaccharide export with SLBB domain